MKGTEYSQGGECGGILEYVDLGQVCGKVLVFSEKFSCYFPKFLLGWVVAVPIKQSRRRLVEKRRVRDFNNQ